jgi:hypothetical protein
MEVKRRLDLSSVSGGDAVLPIDAMLAAIRAIETGGRVGVGCVSIVASGVMSGEMKVCVLRHSPPHPLHSPPSIHHLPFTIFPQVYFCARTSDDLVLMGGIVAEVPVRAVEVTCKGEVSVG